VIKLEYRKKGIKLKKILAVDPEKISALDMQDNTLIFNLADCRKNFYRKLMGPDYIMTVEDKMIGERNSLADPKYIIFYSYPVSYIEVDYDGYKEITDMLYDNGLQTFDLT
jgi:hypothetical protein